MGAEKWLDIELWDSPYECFKVLKSRGYRIATTHLGMDAVQFLLLFYIVLFQSCVVLWTEFPDNGMDVYILYVCTSLFVINFHAL